MLPPAYPASMGSVIQSLTPQLTIFRKWGECGLVGKEGINLEGKFGGPRLYTMHLYSRRGNRPGLSSWPQPGPLYQNAERTRGKSSLWEILDSGCLLSTSLGMCRTLFSCQGVMKRNLHMARVNGSKTFWEDSGKEERKVKEKEEAGQKVRTILSIYCLSCLANYLD